MNLTFSDLSKYSLFAKLLFLFQLLQIGVYSENQRSVKIKKGAIYIILSNLQNKDGQIMVALHNSADAFPTESEKAFRSIKVKTIKAVNKKIVFKDIPFGVYAISVFHDENSNNKLDFNFFPPSPSESTGASNDAKGFMGPPKYKDARFELKEKMKIIKIKMN